MNRTLLFLIILLSQALGVLAQGPGTKLSAAEISFVFVSKGVDGRISGFRSTSSIDWEAIETSVFKGSVETKTLKTGNFLRDWSLRGQKYFNADDFPEITFESSSIAAGPSGFSVQGHLTIKGTTKPITIDFVRKSDHLTGTTTLFSSDFGINIKDDRRDNEVRVKMVFTLGSTD